MAKERSGSAPRKKSASAPESAPTPAVSAYTEATNWRDWVEGVGPDGLPLGSTLDKSGNGAASSVAIGDRVMMGNDVAVSPSPGDIDPYAERNPGIDLDLSWIESVRVNRAAVERRASSLAGRRTVKKEWQAAWLLKAIACMDLTTLAGDDTPGNVARLCAKARRPLRDDIVEALGIRDLNLTVGAVCVYHELVAPAVAALAGTTIPVAAVSTGFPAGLTPYALRLGEIAISVGDGAREIDIVISRRHVLSGNWRALYDEMRSYRAACGDAHVKAILATGELGSLKNVAKASLVCMMAGADFVKTSTGKEPTNATIGNSLVMARTIRDYESRTGHAVGFKPAGGIRTAKHALDLLILMKEELGDNWLTPERFRLGASSLLTDIERQLEHYVTGRYAATHRQPMP